MQARFICAAGIYSPSLSVPFQDTNKRGHNSHINAAPIYLRRSKIMPLLIRGQNATQVEHSVRSAGSWLRMFTGNSEGCEVLE